MGKGLGNSSVNLESKLDGLVGNTNKILGKYLSKKRGIISKKRELYSLETIFQPISKLFMIMG
jgi:hypothetical protein